MSSDTRIVEGTDPGLVRREPYKKLQRIIESSAGPDRLEPKRIVNIHGSDSYERTSLLSAFRAFCLERSIPAALVSATSRLTEVEVMREYATGLEEFHLKMPSFMATLRQELKPPPAPPGSDLSREGLDLAEAAGRTLAPHLSSPLGILLSLAHRFAAFVLELFRYRRSRRLPPNSLIAAATAAFRKDIAKKSRSRRIVLLLDGLEKIPHLNDWFLKWLQDLPPTVLVVIAGRGALSDLLASLPGWPNWPNKIEDVPLERLSEVQRRDFVVRQFQLFSVNAPSPATVKAIVDGEDTSPLLLRMGAYAASRFGSGPAEKAVVESLISHGQERERRILEAAGTMRSFDEASLRFLTEEKQQPGPRLIDSSLLVELRKPQSYDGWTLYGPIREGIREYLQEHDGERSRELHRRACEYYKRQREQVNGGQPRTQQTIRRWQNSELEYLYHQYHLSAHQWIEEFRGVFETAFRRNDLQWCRRLLSDAEAYASDEEQQPWLQCYQALIAIHLGNLEKGYRILRELSEPVLAADTSEFKILRSEAFAAFYALQDQQADVRPFAESYLRYCESHCDIPGEVGVLTFLGSLYKRNGGADYYLKRAKDRSAGLLGDRFGDKYTHLAASVDKELADSYRLQGRFEEATACIESSIHLYEKRNARFELAHAIRTRAMLMVSIGDLRAAEESFREAIRLFKSVAAPNEPRMYERFWPMIGLGDVALGKGELGKANDWYKKALEVCSGSAFEKAIAEGCLAELCCAQGEWRDAVAYANSSIKVLQEHEDTYGVAFRGAVLGEALLRMNRVWDSLDSLNSAFLAVIYKPFKFLKSRLLLGKSELYLATGDAQAFGMTARLLERFAEYYHYWDHLALLRVYEGAWALRRLTASTRTEIAASAKVDAVQCFTYARICALRYNVFHHDRVSRRIDAELKRILPTQVADRHWIESEVRARLSGATIGERPFADFERWERARYAIGAGAP
jgi:tetratricopeptide (TPR) repeat protein